MNPTIKRFFLLNLKAFGIILKLTVIDQLSKWWFIGYLKSIPFRIVQVNKFLNFVYVWNYGISFGMFSEHYQHSNRFFIIFNILVIMYLGYHLLKSVTLKTFLGYCFIVGGACGNLYDRIMRGAVFDFIDIHYHDYHFAIFNLADAFITVGALLLILDYYMLNKAESIDRAKQTEEASFDPIAIEADKIRKIDSRVNKVAPGTRRED